jgi:hypothetical protein
MGMTDRPLLRGHYTRFNATTRQSGFSQRIGTFSLRGSDISSIASVSRMSDAGIRVRFELPAILAPGREHLTLFILCQTGDGTAYGRLLGRVSRAVSESGLTDKPASRAAVVSRVAELANSSGESRNGSDRGPAPHCGFRETHDRPNEPATRSERCGALRRKLPGAARLPAHMRLTSPGCSAAL